MENFGLDSQQWSGLVARLGGEEALTASARERRAFLRARGVKSAADVLRFAFMYGPGGYSLRSLAASASARGLADVSDVAILDRLKGSADWLQSLCEERLAHAAQAVGAQTLGRPIRIVDGSRIEGPGGRAWRLHLCYDPALGRIVEAVVTPAKEGERLDRLAVTPGEIRLGDRAFPQPNGVKNTLGAGADVLVRVTWNSLKLTDAADKPLDWLALFEAAAAQGSLETPVRLHKARGRFEPIAMRLSIIKKPPAAAIAARAKARRASRKDQHRTDPRTLAGAEHVVLLTSLDREQFPTERLAALYRLRWQIELALKRLKSILHIDRLPAKDPDLARAWLNAHLLFALLLDETIVALDAISP
jgi:transposase